jgi:hypothetical protein
VAGSLNILLGVQVKKGWWQKSSGDQQMPRGESVMIW